MEQPETPQALDISKIATPANDSGELLGAIVKQLRPKQWAKNLIIFAPPLFGGKFNDLNAIAAAGGCLISFCLISSGTYILNDVIDVELDRAHPNKRFRPIASGKLRIPLAVAIAVGCFAAGLLLSFFVRPSLTIICLIYMGLNVLYSKWLKNFAIMDILCIASGFVLRAVAGAVAVMVIPSMWFLLCTSLGALFLALEKRRQELAILAGNSSSHRRALSEYNPQLLQRLESLIVPCLLTSYALYSFLSMHGHAMMATVPVVLYGVMRYQLLSERGTGTATPEEVFWKDRPIQIALLLWVAICALIIYGKPTLWLESISRYIDSFRPSF